jgi:hypothetical protein
MVTRCRFTACVVKFLSGGTVEERKELGGGCQWRGEIFLGGAAHVNDKRKKHDIRRSRFGTARERESVRPTHMNGTAAVAMATVRREVLAAMWWRWTARRERLIFTAVGSRRRW